MYFVILSSYQNQSKRVTTIIKVSVYNYTYISFYASVIDIYLFIYISFYNYVYNYISIYTYIYLYLYHLFIWLPFYIYTYLNCYLYTYKHIYLSEGSTKRTRIKRIRFSPPPPLLYCPRGRKSKREAEKCFALPKLYPPQNWICQWWKISPSIYLPVLLKKVAAAFCHVFWHLTLWTTALEDFNKNTHTLTYMYIVHIYILHTLYIKHSQIMAQDTFTIPNNLNV